MLGQSVHPANTADNRVLWQPVLHEQLIGPVPSYSSPIENKPFGNFVKARVGGLMHPIPLVENPLPPMPGYQTGDADLPIMLPVHEFVAD